MQQFGQKIPSCGREVGGGPGNVLLIHLLLEVGPYQYLQGYQKPIFTCEFPGGPATSTHMDPRMWKQKLFKYLTW